MSTEQTPLYTLMTDNAFQEGTGAVKDYIKKAKELGIKNLTLMDKGSIQDFVTFYKTCKSEDINPSIGVKLSIESFADVQNYLVLNKKYLENISLFFGNLMESSGVSSFGGSFKDYLLDIEYENIELLNKVLFSAFDYNLKIEKKSAKSSIDKAFKSLHSSLKEIMVDFGVDENIAKNLTKEDVIDKISSLNIDENFKFFTRSENDFVSSGAFFAYDDSGFENIRKLISYSQLYGQKFVAKGKKREKEQYPTITLSNINKYSDGLYFMGSGFSDILLRSVKSGDIDTANKVLEKLYNIFGKDKVVSELTVRMEDDKSVFLKGEEVFNSRIAEYATKNNIPLIATQDVRFVNKEDYQKHKIKRNIILQSKFDSIKTFPKEFSGQYMRSPKELKDIFQDFPEAIENANVLLQKVSLNPDLDISVLPEFPIPKGKTDAEYLSELAHEGVYKRLVKIFDKRWNKWVEKGQVSGTREEEFDKKLKIYKERTDVELEIINGMGFPGYFLIVQDFINWAKSEGVPVGPGRGSGAGSLVAYGLGITDIDPLEFDLLFERFLNPERVSMPDFDIDFGSGFDSYGNEVGRGDVISYVAKKYNDPKNEFPSVGQIATVGTMKAKSAIKDAGKALGFEISWYEKLAKLIPEDNVNITLEEALEESEPLMEKYNRERRTRELIDACRFLEGKKKSTGAHAGGVVIGRGPLTNFSAIEYETESQKVITQYDMKSVETAGLVKFDFLGLNTLSILSEAIKYIKDNGVEFDFESIDIDDEKTFEFMRTAQTHSLFQIESAGMKDLVKKLELQNLEELSALLALFRPGPLESGMVDDFIERKHGRQEVEYPHPDLENVLKNTYGVILYQEQVMQIAQVLADYSLGQADLLRRAMGKKKPEEMAKQREMFITGTRKNNIPDEQANYIFDLMEKFAGYGFNKSHSVAYAMVSYQTAYLKTHYPNEFMSAVLSLKMDDIEKIENIVGECKNLNLEVIKPDINQSGYKFTSKFGSDNKILFGIGGIKGTGSSGQKFIAEREKNGSYKNMKDIFMRLGKSVAKKNTLESLIYSGAMDNLDLTYDFTLDKELDLNTKRTLLLHEAEVMADAMPTVAEMKKIVTKNGEPDFKKSPLINYEEALNKKFDDRRRLLSEKSVMGIYSTGHPLDIENFRKRLNIREPILENLATVRPNGETQKVAGVITDVRVNTIKKQGNNFGKKLASVTIEDGNDTIQVTVFPDQYDIFKDYLEVGNVVSFKGELKEDDFAQKGFKMIGSEMISLIPYQVFEVPSNNFKNNKGRNSSMRR